MVRWTYGDLITAWLLSMGTFPMSLRLIKEIHAVLMEGVRGGEKTPGEFKKTQNWIGPPGCSLKDARFVPPPPHEADAAMGALEVYIHQPPKLPVLVDCALIHYLFETIHPFLDGNGRLGRLLITFYLHWKGVMEKPLLYLSYYFRKYRQEYYDRLKAPGGQVLLLAHFGVGQEGGSPQIWTLSEITCHCYQIAGWEREDQGDRYKNISFPSGIL